MAIALREILARFGISFDTAALDKGNKAVDGLASKLAGLAGALGTGLAIRQLANMTKEVTLQADVLAKQARALGLSTSELESWNYAAGQSGVSAETLAAAIQRIGSGSSDKGLAALGVATKKANGELRSTTDVLEEVSNKLAAIEDPTLRGRRAAEIFGKSYAKILPALESGAESIRASRKEFEKLGGGFGDAFGEKAEEFSTTLGRLDAATLSLKARLASILLPVIERFAQIATRVTAGINRLSKETNLLEGGMATLAVATTILGRKMFLAGIRAIKPWLPWIVALGLAVLLSDELITLWEGGDTLIGRAIDGIFGEGSSQKAVKWVKGVVKSTKEFFADTSRGWAEFKGGLELMWFDLTTWMSKQWKQFAAGVELIFFDIGAAGARVAAWVGDTFAEMWNGIIGGAQGLLSAMQSVAAKVPGMGKVADAIAGANAKLEASRSDTGRVDRHDELVRGARSTILDRAEQDQEAVARQRAQLLDRIDAQVRAASTVNAPVNIEVNVPPGTPQQQARAVANAAAQGVKSQQKATKNHVSFVAG